MTVSTEISVADQDWFNEASLRRVLALLNEDGGEARVVGGAVRNALLGENVGDIDIATTLVPDDVIGRAEAAGIKAVPTGIDHGTVTLVVDNKPFEVTTLRADIETFGRHAQVAFGTDWQVDAERRDFTINALYASADGAVVDPVGGLADLETRTIRFIGDPGTRIAEDYLRVLRFFRFFAWYGYGRPDAEGLKACARSKEKLSELSAERVWMETRKLLSAADPGRALLWMRQSGVLTAILPETEKWGIDSIPGIVAAETALDWEPDPLLRLISMVPPDQIRMKQMAERLRMSNAETARLVDWAATSPPDHDIADTALDRLLYRGKPAAIADRLKLGLAAARMRALSDPGALAEAGAYGRLLDRASRWQKPVFPVSGADLMAKGMTEGPALGEALKALEDRWIESGFRLEGDELLTEINAS